MRTGEGAKHKVRPTVFHHNYRQTLSRNRALETRCQGNAHPQGFWLPP